MYELDTNFENQLAKEHEKQAKCCHSYLKCGLCGVAKDELNDKYRQRIAYLEQLLITNEIIFER